jgi:hypothetical protein
VLELSGENILDSNVLQRKLGIHALQPLVLRFELLDPLELRQRHTRVLVLSLVIRRVADAVLMTDLGDWNS